MAHLVRPLMQWQRLHHQYIGRATFHHLRLPNALPPSKTSSESVSFVTPPSDHRNVHFRSRGLRLPNAPLPSGLQENERESDSDSDAKKSRNEKKREGRRAVRWGMELASFSNHQIKRILRAASLEREVFDALMLVKRLGRDVREGKRRQFSYIGRLLREVQPDLMDSLIQATKDGDERKLQVLSGPETLASEDGVEDVYETDNEEEEGSDSYSDIATRWLDGLISKDIEITKEIYSLHDVEFDRQELRKLVRKVHGIQDQQKSGEESEGQTDAALMRAKRALNRFLQALAKRIPIELI